MTKMIFISWIAYSRRSQLIADKFQIKLYLIQSLKRYYILAPLRYVLQSIRTLIILLRERPKIVFIQNPPVFAVLVIYLYAKLAGARYIIDSHTGALLDSRWQWSLPLHAFLSRQAITTLVTNEHLKSLVQSWKADAFIIADIPAVFPTGRPFSLNSNFSVAVINTFSKDEPVEEILEAAGQLPEVDFYITGDPIRAKKYYLQDHPANVHFTGFLPDEDYIGLLRGVQTIMVLTKDDHTMQRGACEAVSLGQPIITSNWPVLAGYFNKGTIHVDNSPAGIRAGVLAMRENYEVLAEEISLLQRERWTEWQEKYQQLTNLIEAQPGLEVKSPSV